MPVVLMSQFFEEYDIAILYQVRQEIQAVIDDKNQANLVYMEG